MTIDIAIISAFTKNGTGGNRAAVVLDADRFTTSQKSVIAAKAGLSETAFVSASTVADFKLDFFTPTRQIAHCGHATIATFSYLKQIGKIKGTTSSKMTIDGRREIRLVGEEAFMEQRAPQFLPLGDDGAVAVEALALTPDEVASTSPVIVNTGNSFAVIEVKQEALLQRLHPDFHVISNLSEKYGLVGFYVFCKPLDPALDATARMFAPAYGIEEESATGMAAGPLACYLFMQGERKKTYQIEQGRFMKPPSISLINVDLVIKQDAIARLYAGGNAKLVEHRYLTI